MILTNEGAPHKPVLLNEMLQYLSPQDGEIYLDTTFGSGGYSSAILSSCNCELVAIDQDPATKIYANNLQKKYKNRFNFIETNFADCFGKFKSHKFNGIVMDLGVSSMQIDQAVRGFSFMRDGPLDMRMSGVGLSASDFINGAEEIEIANVIYKYGDEVASRSIARKIIERRLTTSITTTTQLADIVREVRKSRGKIDAATKTFQAIRIYINKELEKLEQFLAKVGDMLAPGGRLVIVSFHSLEDRIVKYFIKEHSAKKVARSKYSQHIETIEPGKWMKQLITKAITPSKEEVRNNPRSRSAKLRAIMKEVYDEN